VVGAGSFGPAVAILLERAGLRTTLLARTHEQATLLAEARQNERYLPGVELPRDLRVRELGVDPDQFGRPAADIFLEVLALSELSGGQARTFVGRAGTGDLVATALAPSSRNRSAGELLAQGVPAEEIEGRIGQAVEALDTVRLLSHAIERQGFEAPVVSALARLIEGSLPLDEWVAMVRAKQPAPASFRRPSTWWARVRGWFDRWFGIRREPRPETPPPAALREQPARPGASDPLSGRR
jgi:glycerol-3-phosphate dehydrogenase